MKAKNLLIAELAERAGYYWDAAIGRYRNAATGRLVSERTLLSLGERYAATVQDNIARLTDRFISGNISIDRWQELMARELKDGYLTNLLIGRGGRNAATWADYGRIGGRLRFEYRRLDLFAREIAQGTLSPDYIRARANMYAEGCRVAYFDGLTAAKREAGFTEERRILNPAEHCEDCVGYAGQGWQPIGTLPEPGTGSRCMHNCRCDKEYRKNDDTGQ